MKPASRFEINNISGIPSPQSYASQRYNCVPEWSVQGYGVDAKYIDREIYCAQRPFRERLDGQASGGGPRQGPLWVDEVYSLCARGARDEAMDVVFERVEALLGQGHFGACDDLLRAVDLKRLDASLILTFVSVTFAAREELPWRRHFVHRAEAQLKELVPDRAERLLERLR